MGLETRADNYYLSLYDIFLPRREVYKQRRIAEAMQAGAPADVIMKHCGMSIRIGPSAVDSDAEEDQPVVQPVSATSSKKGSATAVDDNTRVNEGTA